MSKIKKIFESLHKMNEKIAKVGSKWQVQSEDGKKVLGSYDTKEAAEQRLKQIEAFKHMRESEDIVLDTLKRYDAKPNNDGTYTIYTDRFDLIKNDLKGTHRTIRSEFKINDELSKISVVPTSEEEDAEFQKELDEAIDYEAARPFEAKLQSALRDGDYGFGEVMDELVQFLPDDTLKEFVTDELYDEELEGTGYDLLMEYLKDVNDESLVLDKLLKYLPDDIIGEFIESFDSELLDESSKTNEQSLTEMPRLPHLTKKIIDELDKKAKLLAKRKYGADIVDYVSVTSGPSGVEFSAELEYEDMDEIADELNKILERHGFHTYFEAEDSGFWTAYIDPQFIDENYEDDMAGNEEPEIMSTEAFVNWHDKEYMSPEFDFKVEKIYKIFADNNCSEEDDVDVCYNSLSDEDKKKVTEIIRKGGH